MSDISIDQPISNLSKKNYSRPYANDYEYEIEGLRLHEFQVDLSAVIKTDLNTLRVLARRWQAVQKE